MTDLHALNRFFDVPEVECILCIGRDNLTVVTTERQYDDALMDRLIAIEATIDCGLFDFTPRVFLEGWVFAYDLD